MDKLIKMSIDILIDQVVKTACVKMVHCFYTLKRYISMSVKRFAISMVLCCSTTIVGAQMSLGGCGSLENGFGPYDYRSVDAARRNMVEKFHFPPKVEALKGGSTASTPGGDLAYTLRALPNHPRALMATIRFAEQTKKNPPPEMVYTVSCWLDRAENFSPDDATVKMLFGIYLIRSGKPKESIPKLESALELSMDNTNIIYNLGLAYFELNDFDKSVELAHRAYEAGFPLPGLRDKLRRAGKWVD